MQTPLATTRAVRHLSVRLSPVMLTPATCDTLAQLLFVAALPQARGISALAVELQAIGHVARVQAALRDGVRT